LNIEETQDWFSTLRRFGIKPGLERTTRVLASLGNPEKGLRFYHVAGTNGKGSVCAMLSAMLRATGARVGVYTSPGLAGFNGRMTIDGQRIEDDEFARYAACVRDVMEADGGEDPLTEFEVLTVMALLYFAAAAVDVVVWETGLGGRYDATNVVTPCVTAITNVSYDHVQILGPTLTDIAFDKAGIIKHGVPVVTGADGEAYRMIEQVAKTQGAPLMRLTRDFSLVRTGQTGLSQTGYYRGLHRDTGEVNLSLFGRHQLANAAVALAMLETQIDNRETDHWARAIAALPTVRWPLRFEVFRGASGPVVLDGAHNPGAAFQLSRALTDFSVSQGSQNEWSMLIGVLADKDVTPMLRSMLPHAKDVIICRPNHVRGADPADIRASVHMLRPDLPVRVIENVHEATSVAVREADALVIWGSLYMVEQARETISKLEMNYWI
jgi:dihydrofolate synthase/folylpolyglutamate synthase